jgi:hypothetical protein
MDLWRINPPWIFGGFLSEAEKGKNTSVLPTLHLQPGAQHSVCMARNPDSIKDIVLTIT